MTHPTLVTVARGARLAVLRTPVASFPIPDDVARFLDAVVPRTAETGFSGEPAIMFLRVETWYAEPFHCAWR